MADRLQDNLGLIRALIERAPDKAVRELEAALGGGMGGSALSGVRAMVDAEVADRGVRDAVLQPIRPMFGMRADDIAQLTFPRAALSPLWCAIKGSWPDKVDNAAIASRIRAQDGVFPEVYDEICELAAEALRVRATPAFAAVADQTGDDARQLAGCLELTRLARPCLGRLGEWLQRMTDERAATIRLAYKDAVAVAEDGGPRLFEILFSNLSEPWVVLRLISAVMIRPVDNYVSESELAVFGDRLLADIERRLVIIKDFDVTGGVPAGLKTGGEVRMVGAITDEFEQSLNLGKEGPWGGRLKAAKGELAKSIEGRLRKSHDIINHALPMAPVRIGGRVLRQGAKLDAPPDPAQIARARAIITLIEQVRSASVNGGYNSLRLKTIDELESRLGSHVEDLLDALHNGLPDEIPNARLYLDEVADLVGRLRDDKAAQIVRRRAAAA